MNIENAKLLLDQLRRLPDEKFFMGEWIIHPEEARRVYEDRVTDGFMSEETFSRGFTGYTQAISCGTVGCGAGWACLLNNLGEDRAGDRAAEWLGLKEDQANYLFMGRWRRGGGNMDNVTREQFVTQLAFTIELAEKGERLPGSL